MSRSRPALESTLDFEQLARELAAVGAQPSIIARTVRELKDHYDDAETAALEQGLGPADARREACRCLGSSERIVTEVAARSELLDWRHRWPQSARCVDTLSYCCALPAAPFVYCVSHPSGILRWGLSSGIAVCITAALLLGLQSLIGWSVLG